MEREFNISEELQNTLGENDEQISGQCVCLLLTVASGVTAALLPVENTSPVLKTAFVAIALLGTAGTAYYGGLALKTGDKLKALEGQLKK